MPRTYTFFWHNGKTTLAIGTTVGRAAASEGYSVQDVLDKLDFWDRGDTREDYYFSSDQGQWHRYPVK